MFKYKKSRLSAFFAAINIVLADIGGKKTTYIISFRAKSIIIMSISVVMLVACERHASTSEQMDIAEKLMNTKTRFGAYNFKQHSRLWFQRVRMLPDMLC